MNPSYVFALSLSPGSGPSLFMVLSREDAVVGWRALMGSTNPEEAAQQDPNWWVCLAFRDSHGIE